MQNKELCPYFSFKVVLKPVYILWIKVKKKHLCCKNPPPLYLPEPNPTQRGFTSAAALATVSFLSPSSLGHWLPLLSIKCLVERGMGPSLPTLCQWTGRLRSEHAQVPLWKAAFHGGHLPKRRSLECRRGDPRRGGSGAALCKTITQHR